MSKVLPKRPTHASRKEDVKPDKQASIFSEIFPNQCKGKTNSKVPSNILPLHIQYTFPIQARPVAIV